jgi:hypothetical protein
MPDSWVRECKPGLRIISTNRGDTRWDEGSKRKTAAKAWFVDQRGKNVFKVRLSVLLPPYLDAVTFSGTVTFTAFSKPCGLGYRSLRPT